MKLTRNKLMATIVAIIVTATVLLSRQTKTFNIYLPLTFTQDTRNLAKGTAWAYFGKRPISERGHLAKDIMRIGWFHNWGISAINPLKLYDVEFVPMWWCDQWPSDAIGDNVKVDFKQLTLDRLGRDYDGYLLFLNEPDLPPAQCDRTPKQGAKYYIWIKENLPNVKLIGPMTSHIDGLNGYPWLIEWRKQVIKMTGQPPKVYAYSLHDYMPYHKVGWLTNKLYDLMIKWGDGDKKIWVTEYSKYAPDKMAEATEYFANDPRIERFAGFTPDFKGEELFEQHRFFEWESEELTPIGKAFVESGNGDDNE